MKCYTNKEKKEICDTNVNDKLIQNLPIKALPKHVAIIMDGNNRWAKRNRLKILAGGHKKGLKAVRSVIECCRNYHVEVLSLFAFSSENWRRPNEEVSALMQIFLNALQKEVSKLHEYGIKFRVIGDISAFNSSIKKAIYEAEELTKNNKQSTLIVAANYGGRWDITQACKKIAIKVSNGSIDPDAIDQNLIDKHMSTAGVSEPDLLIRTSGEYRVSNFMLWQCAYTEFYFTDTLWPDFDKNTFHDAMVAYVSRNRRFGLTSNVK